jgi:hypothetical protein
MGIDIQEAKERGLSLEQAQAYEEKLRGLDFESFWIIYPRKVAKAHARKMWSRLTESQKFAALAAIPVHVRYWKIAGRDMERIPHCGSWIGGERWEDELEMPEPTSSNDWMKTTSGIEAKAKQVGITPRAGEDWHSLKARILGAMKAA